MADARVVRRQRKAVITRLLGKIQRLVVESEVEGVRQKLVQIKESFNEFEAAHDVYHDTLEDEEGIEESDIWFAEVERAYIAGVKEAKWWLQSLEVDDVRGDAHGFREDRHKSEGRQDDNPEGGVDDKSEIGSLSASALAQAEMINLLSMPKVEIDKFDGDPLEYQSFITIFDETVHGKTSDDHLKLARLLQYTTGPAKAAIKNCALIGGEKGYQQAREILSARFGNSHLISQRIISDLKHGRAVNRVQELQQLADEASMAYVALNKLSMLSEVESQQSVLDILKRCPQFVGNKWRQKALDVKRETGDYPRFVDFVKFLKIVASDSCDPVYGRDVQSRSVSRGVCHNVVGERFVARSEIAGQVRSQQMYPCVVCQERHHLFHCDKFKAMPPQKRLDLVAKCGLCFNCLMNGHRAYECKKQSVCSVPGCGRKHTKFIHVENPASGRYRLRENGSEDIVNAVSNVNCGNTNVYLPIVPVIVDGKYRVNALLDSGSTNTFVSSGLDRKLRLPGSNTVYRMKTLGSDSTVSSKMVSLEVSSIDGEEAMKLTNVLIVPSIPVTYPTRTLDLKGYPHLADIPINSIKGDIRVDVLIGMDHGQALMPLEVRSSADKRQPYAVRTLFGWCLNGPLPGGNGGDVTANFVKVEQINNDLVNLWNIEREIDDETKSWSCEDHQVVDLWEKEMAFKDGHYYLPIPWRNGTPNLPCNRRSAVSRLHSLVKRLKHTNEFDKYEEKLLEMVSKGYAEEVPNEELNVNDGSVWYLPHHGVRSASKPGKLRIVFDCAAKHAGVSLNGECFQGPDLISKLLHVILRFRQFPIAIMADIEAMYHQVKIPLKDRNALRFLWWENDVVKEYRMTSHLFGGVWCAASSTYALRQSVKDFPCSDLVVNTVNDAFYVDDMLKSVQTTDDGLEVVDGTKAVLSCAGFNLTKFVSNVFSLTESVSEQCKTVEVKELSSDVRSRALGVQWNVSRDTFYYEVKASSNVSDKVTKHEREQKGGGS